MGGCQVFDECMTNHSEDSCLEDEFCEWAYGTCIVGKTGRGELGGCILIDDESTCKDQSGCTWVGSKNIMLPILVIVAFVVVLFGVGFGIWHCCRVKLRRLAAEEQAANSSPVSTNKDEIVEVEF
jgi:hypothetical protein